MKSKLLLIINPIAGNGLAPLIENDIKASGIEEKYEVTISYSEKRGHAAQLANTAVENKFQVVVAVGGDGTINETASSLVNSSTALGIIPSGSGNGLAMHLQYPKNPLQALLKIKNGKLHKIDTMRVNNRFAVNVSGFGFDGYVASLFDKQRKRGLRSYTLITLREYFSYPEIKFQISIDDQQFDQAAHMIVIANASQFGNAAIIAPNADLKDGLANIIIVKRPPLHLLPSTFYRLFNGTLKSNRYTKMFTGKKLLIKTSNPIHLHIDGEPMDPISEVEVTVSPSTLNVIY